jgi:2-aminoethylphosphonate-pyruvate transaminase
MTDQLHTAVILAAGMGTRLKGYTTEMPKGFLVIDGQSLIERSISNLLEAGISNILIGTGYFHEHFDSLKEKFPGITTFRNEDFATTGSMYTLYVLRELIKSPFLLLESDLLYDPIALEYLLSDANKDIILASGATHSGDEVFIQHSAEGFLQNMSKDRSILDHIDGELVGISKLTKSTLDMMVSFSEAQFSKGKMMINYEDALVGTSINHNIVIKVIQDLAWCEIDDENHLRRAVTKVYPKILERAKSRL